MVKLRDKERVLARLLELRNPNTNSIYRPPHLLSSFPGLTEDEVILVLNALQSEGLIKVATAPDLDESDNIHVISFGDRAPFYLEEQAKHREERKSDTRRYWITTIIAIIALVKSFLPEIRAVLAWLWQLLTQ